MDKRKFNGGNSTKAKGIDKRKNEYKTALDEAGSVEKVKNVLNMLYDKSIHQKDVKASTLYLAYYLGKPKETKDVNLTMEQPLFDL